MASAESDEACAVTLAEKALKLVQSVQQEDGSRSLREAIALAPEHPHVKAAFEKIQQGQSGQSLLQACRTYASQPDETAAQEVLRILSSTSAPPPSECIPLLYDRSTSGGTLGDEILSTLLRRSPEARRYLTAKLEDATTDVVFESLWNSGDKSTQELISVLLDRSIWPSETPRHRCEKDVFILLIAKLMEAGQDDPGRALSKLGRLFATDAEHLHSSLDADSLAVILSCLDIHSPPEMRSQATFITARYLAASGEPGEQLLSEFITSRISEATVDNIALAFSAAAAVFPLVPSTASRLFLTDGFAQSLVPLLQRKSKSTRVRQTALEMLSAACIDNSCRETISKYCTEWIEEQLSSKHEPSGRIAAVVLAKLRTAEPTQTQIPNGEATLKGSKEVEPLVEKFKELMMKSDDDKDETTRQSSIEGLAYASLIPSVKAKLANDETFLKRLIDTIRQSSDKPALLFGALSILVNLTRYLPNLSEEQKRMAQLKAYANTSKVKTEPDEEDQDEAVTKRCAAVLHAGVIPVLAHIRNKVSTTGLLSIMNILLSLSKEQKHRGIMAQQGAVKLLLQSHTTNDKDKQTRHVAAHALARILISVNPSLLFTSSASPSITTAISPLVSLLTEDAKNDNQPSNQSNLNNDQPRDLLPTFEALLALTNLASMTDENISNQIVRQTYPAIEELLLSKHTLIQRATVELICNLMTCSEGVKKFVDMEYDDISDETITVAENGTSNDHDNSKNKSKRIMIFPLDAPQQGV
ncbi:MAG: methyltransferase protein [Watsoniomyces obsoletus]|nr:MAG: methyltransferase protein [Watsoniomyces obsoletus]